MADLEHRFVHVNGVRLHVVEAGPSDAPRVLLLHGFPEFWYSWRHQIEALAPHFRVIAPDQRGYAESDKPPSGYDLDTLAADMRALVEQAGGRAHVVGHDWGAVVAWHVATFHPDVVDRLVTIDGPHIVAMARALRSSPAQLARSWYMAFFQIPWLPERLLTARGAAAIRGMRRDFVHPERFTDEDAARFAEAFLRPGAARAAIAWYRALARTLPSLVRAYRGRRVTARTLVLHGEQDRYLGPETIAGLDRVCGDVRVERIPGCGHFAPQDCPEEINRALLGFLRGPRLP